MTRTSSTDVRPPATDVRERPAWPAYTLLAAGVLGVAVVRAALPYRSTEGSAAIATEVAGHPSAQKIVLWFTLLALLTLVPGAVGVGAVAARHARRIGTAGLVISVAGFACLPAVAVMDFAAFAAARAGVDAATTGQILDRLNDDPVLIIGTAVFVLGHAAGMILVGVAMLRSSAAPAWAAWLLIVSSPLHLVFVAVVASNWLDAAAWVLTAVGVLGLSAGRRA
jgi:hypothetical protein